MATTVSRLRAIVTADVGQAIFELTKFGLATRGARDEAKQALGGVDNAFKSMLSANLVSGVINGFKNALVNGLKSAIGEVKQLFADAFTAVKDYEMLSMSMNQLVANQIMAADVTDNMAEALQRAARPTKELLGWIQELAIKSPFGEEGVANVVKMASVFNFTVAEAKRLTQALVDMAATSGQTDSDLQRIVLLLGQMVAKGKLTGEEIRELSTNKLPALAILADYFGVNTTKMKEMVEDGAVPAGKALEAIVSYMETNFAGAAARATNTWQGLTSSLGDVKTQGLRALFTGMFSAIQPEIAGIVDYLASDDFKGRLLAVGTQLGTALKAGIATAKVELKTMLEADVFGDVGGMTNKVMTGDFSKTAETLVGRIIQGSMTLAVHASSIAQALIAGGAYVADLLGTVVPKLNALFGQFLNVLVAEGEAFMAEFQSALHMNLNPGYLKAAEQKRDIATNAETTWAALLETISDELQPSKAALTTQLQEIEDAKRVGLEAANDFWVKYERAMDRAGIAMSMGPARAAGGWINPLTGEQENSDDAVDAALGGKSAFVSGMGDAGEDAGSELKSKLKSALSDIKDMLSKGADYSIRLGVVGDKPADPLAPGADGPFEALYRIQDVALNAGTDHPGADTGKWMETYFGGMDQGKAIELAKAITSSFQQGNYNELVMPYVDTDKLKDIYFNKQEAAASQENLANLIGADPEILSSLIGGGSGSGGLGVGSVDMSAITGVAPAMKDALTTELGKISGDSPTIIDAMLSNFSGGDGGKGADIDVSAFVPGFLGAIDKTIEKNKDEIAQRGKNLWGTLGGGFIEGAKNDPTFQNAIDAMVANALSNIVEE